MKNYNSTVQLEFCDLILIEQNKYYKITNRKELIKFIDNLTINSFNSINSPYKELICVIDGIAKLIELS